MASGADTQENVPETRLEENDIVVQKSRSTEGEDVFESPLVAKVADEQIISPSGLHEEQKGGVVSEGINSSQIVEGNIFEPDLAEELKVTKPKASFSEESSGPTISEEIKSGSDKPETESLLKFEEKTQNDAENNTETRDVKEEKECKAEEIPEVEQKQSVGGMLKNKWNNYWSSESSNKDADDLDVSHSTEKEILQEDEASHVKSEKSENVLESEVPDRTNESVMKDESLEEATTKIGSETILNEEDRKSDNQTEVSRDQKKIDEDEVVKAIHEDSTEYKVAPEYKVGSDDLYSEVEASSEVKKSRKAEDHESINLNETIQKSPKETSYETPDESKDQNTIHESETTFDASSVTIPEESSTRETSFESINEKEKEYEAEETLEVHNLQSSDSLSVENDESAFSKKDIDNSGNSVSITEEILPVKVGDKGAPEMDPTSTSQTETENNIETPKEIEAEEKECKAEETLEVAQKQSVGGMLKDKWNNYWSSESSNKDVDDLADSHSTEKEILEEEESSHVPVETTYDEKEATEKSLKTEESETVISIDEKHIQSDSVSGTVGLEVEELKHLNSSKAEGNNTNEEQVTERCIESVQKDSEEATEPVISSEEKDTVLEPASTTENVSREIEEIIPTSISDKEGPHMEAEATYEIFQVGEEIPEESSKVRKSEDEEKVTNGIKEVTRKEANTSEEISEHFTEHHIKEEIPDREISELGDSEESKESVILGEERLGSEEKITDHEEIISVNADSKSENPSDQNEEASEIFETVEHVNETREYKVGSDNTYLEATRSGDDLNEETKESSENYTSSEKNITTTDLKEDEESKRGDIFEENQVSIKEPKDLDDTDEANSVPENSTIVQALAEEKDTYIEPDSTTKTQEIEGLKKFEDVPHVEPGATSENIHTVDEISDEQSLSSKSIKKDVDELPVSHSTEKEILQEEVSKEYTEVSHVESEKSENILESENQVIYSEVPDEIDKSGIKEESHEEAKSETLLNEEAKKNDDQSEVSRDQMRTDEDLVDKAIHDDSTINNLLNRSHGEEEVESEFTDKALKELNPQEDQLRNHESETNASSVTFSEEESRTRDLRCIDEVQDGSAIEAKEKEYEAEETFEVQPVQYDEPVAETGAEKEEETKREDIYEESQASIKETKDLNDADEANSVPESTTIVQTLTEEPVTISKETDLHKEESSTSELTFKSHEEIQDGSVIEANEKEYNAEETSEQSVREIQFSDSQSVENEKPVKTGAEMDPTSTNQTETDEPETESSSNFEEKTQTDAMLDIDEMKHVDSSKAEVSITNEEAQENNEEQVTHTSLESVQKDSQEVKEAVIFSEEKDTVFEPVSTRETVTREIEGLIPSNVTESVGETIENADLKTENLSVQNEEALEICETVEPVKETREYKVGSDDTYSEAEASSEVKESRKPEDHELEKAFTDLPVDKEFDEASPVESEKSEILNEEAKGASENYTSSEKNISTIDLKEEEETKCEDVFKENQFPIKELKDLNDADEAYHVESEKAENVLESETQVLYSEVSDKINEKGLKEESLEAAKSDIQSEASRDQEVSNYSTEEKETVLEPISTKETVTRGIEELIPVNVIKAEGEAHPIDKDGPQREAEYAEESSEVTKNIPEVEIKEYILSDVPDTEISEQGDKEESIKTVISSENNEDQAIDSSDAAKSNEGVETKKIYEDQARVETRDSEIKQDEAETRVPEGEDLTIHARELKLESLSPPEQSSTNIHDMNEHSDISVQKDSEEAVIFSEEKDTVLEPVSTIENVTREIEEFVPEKVFDTKTSISDKDGPHMEAEIKAKEESFEVTKSEDGIKEVTEKSLSIEEVNASASETENLKISERLSETSNEIAGNDELKTENTERDEDQKREVLSDSQLVGNDKFVEGEAEKILTDEQSLSSESSKKDVEELQKDEHSVTEVTPILERDLVDFRSGDISEHKDSEEAIDPIISFEEKDSLLEPVLTTETVPQKEYKAEETKQKDALVENQVTTEESKDVDDAQELNIALNAETPNPIENIIHGSEISTEEKEFKDEEIPELEKKRSVRGRLKDKWNNLWSSDSSKKDVDDLAVSHSTEKEILQEEEAFHVESEKLENIHESKSHVETTYEEKEAMEKNSEQEEITKRVDSFEAQGNTTNEEQVTKSLESARSITEEVLEYHEDQETVVTRDISIQKDSEEAIKPVISSEEKDMLIAPDSTTETVTREIEESIPEKEYEAEETKQKEAFIETQVPIEEPKDLDDLKDTNSALKGDTFGKGLYEGESEIDPTLTSQKETDKPEIESTLNFEEKSQTEAKNNTEIPYAIKNTIHEREIEAEGNNYKAEETSESSNKDVDEFAVSHSTEKEILQESEKSEILQQSEKSEKILESETRALYFEESDKTNEIGMKDESLEEATNQIGSKTILNEESEKRDNQSEKSRDQEVSSSDREYSVEEKSEEDKQIITGSGRVVLESSDTDLGLTSLVSGGDISVQKDSEEATESVISSEDKDPVFEPVLAKETVTRDTEELIPEKVSETLEINEHLSETSKDIDELKHVDSSEASESYKNEDQAIKYAEAEGAETKEIDEDQVTVKTSKQDEGETRVLEGEDIKVHAREIELESLSSVEQSSTNIRDIDEKGNISEYGSFKSAFSDLSDETIQKTEDLDLQTLLDPLAVDPRVSLDLKNSISDVEEQANNEIIADKKFESEMKTETRGLEIDELKHVGSFESSGSNKNENQTEIKKDEAQENLLKSVPDVESESLSPPEQSNARNYENDELTKIASLSTEIPEELHSSASKEVTVTSTDDCVEEKPVSTVRDEIQKLRSGTHRDIEASPELTEKAEVIETRDLEITHDKQDPEIATTLASKDKILLEADTEKTREFESPSGENSNYEQKVSEQEKEDKRVTGETKEAMGKSVTEKEKLEVNIVKSDEHEEVKSDEHEEEHEEVKSDEKDEGENSGNEAPVIVEASKDLEEKVSPKKHSSLLSGVGSKMKHSIAKVKKAITGKHSHSKPH